MVDLDHAPLVYLNADYCPACGNISLPRFCRTCNETRAVQCLECGAVIDRGAIDTPPLGTDHSQIAIRGEREC